MSDLSIEYSLNTPVFVNSHSYSNPSLDILSKKIFDLTKNNNNLSGGGFGLDMSDCISLLIGIIVIIVGFVLLWFKNDLVEAEAIVKTKSCDEGLECKINIIYTVDNTQYSKIISMDKKNVSDTPTIKMYYQNSNPNSIQLYNPNYSIIGIGMIIIGIFIMIFSMGLSNSDSKLLPIKNTETNLYSNSSNKDGFNVVYSK
jgi:hypothetical protein